MNASEPDPRRGVDAAAGLDLSAELDRLVEDGRTGVAGPEEVQRGLARLVLTLVEVLREPMERQALRRMDAGTLNEDEIERLGLTFIALRERMEELQDAFGLSAEDLDLGPLGELR